MVADSAGLFFVRKKREPGERQITDFYLLLYAFLFRGAVGARFYF